MGEGELREAQGVCFGTGPGEVKSKTEVGSNGGVRSTKCPRSVYVSHSILFLIRNGDEDQPTKLQPENSSHIQFPEAPDATGPTRALPLSSNVVFPPHLSEFFFLFASFLLCPGLGQTLFTERSQ